MNVSGLVDLQHKRWPGRSATHLPERCDLEVSSQNQGLPSFPRALLSRVKAAAAPGRRHRPTMASPRPVFPYVLFILLTLLHDSWAAGKNEDSRRPVYVIANMANEIDEVDKFVEEGANAVSVDVTFGANGDPLKTYHGFPCDCRRNCFRSTPFPQFLEYLGQRTKPGSKVYQPGLVLVYFNLKLTSLVDKALVRAGEEIADHMINYLFKRGKSGSRLWIILGVPEVRSVKFFKSLNETFHYFKLHWYLEKIGYDVYAKGPLDEIQEALKAADVQGHTWVGDGSAACLRRSPTQRLKELVAARDTLNWFGNGFLDKVYQWTVDDPELIRKSLRTGVDGIISNNPGIVNRVMLEPEFSRIIRMAKTTDVPWKWKEPEETAGPEEEEDDTPEGGFTLDQLEDMDNEIMSRIKSKKVEPVYDEGTFDEEDYDNSDLLDSLREKIVMYMTKT